MGSLAWIHSAATGAGGVLYSGPTLSPFCSHWCGPVMMHPECARIETAKSNGLIDRIRVRGCARNRQDVLDFARSWLADVLRLFATIVISVAIDVEPMDRTNGIIGLQAVYG